MSGENVEVARGLFPPGRELDGPLIAGHPDMVRDLFEPLIAENFSVTFVPQASPLPIAGPPRCLRRRETTWTPSRSTARSLTGTLTARTSSSRSADNTAGHTTAASSTRKPDSFSSSIPMENWREALEAAGLSE
jgi:hypothetical protein